MKNIFIPKFYWMYKCNIEDLKIQMGIFIKLYRLRSELSQFQLGIEVGHSRDYIGLIERGKVNPSFEIIVKMCNFINLDLALIVSKISTVKKQELLDEILQLEQKNKNQSRKKS